MFWERLVCVSRTGYIIAEDHDPNSSNREMALYNLAMYYKQMQVTQTKVNANNSNENEIR